MKQIGKGPPVACRSGHEGLNYQRHEGKPGLLKKKKKRYLVDPVSLYIAIGQ